jgi:hypothetical protein
VLLENVRREEAGYRATHGMAGRETWCPNQEDQGRHVQHHKRTGFPRAEAPVAAFDALGLFHSDYETLR